MYAHIFATKSMDFQISFWGIYMAHLKNYFSIKEFSNLVLSEIL